ncbi:MAG: hypothetical protein AAFY60_19300, partial [Myxococcota bacterium]
ERTIVVLAGLVAARREIGSLRTDDSLSCNPSGRISEAARDAGYSVATSNNSFGFHFCSTSSCTKTLCTTSLCNSALSYVDASVPEAHTLCR